ncbi:putative leader peptide [Streptomyces sp. NPDC058382]|uniref:putative leader peptide n=1 Tax=unclassified Streptomyces TaxID=2593676 RepID=UPI00363CB20D
MCERTAPPMPFQPTDAGATPPSRAAGTRCAGFFRTRLSARRHIDLHRVSSAICQA